MCKNCRFWGGIGKCLHPCRKSDADRWLAVSYKESDYCALFESKN
nr:MAG TPA: hypothetical protein [Caudoviricetes sp.]